MKLTTFAARPRFTASIVGVALLASCGGDDAADSSTTSVADTVADTVVDTVDDTVDDTVVSEPTTAPATDPPAEPAPTTPATTTPAAPAPTTPASEAPTSTQPGEAACLVGDWVVSEAELDSYFDVVAVNAAFESIVNTGEMRITFTGETYQWTNDFTLVMVIDGEQYEAISSGDISGSYTESGGILTATSTEYNRSGGITKDGEPFVTEGDLLVDIIPARPMDSLPFTCDGPTLVLGAGPIAGAQHAVTLTAA